MGNAIYDADIEAGIRAGLPTLRFESLIFADIRNACDILRLFMNPLRGWMVTSALKCRRRSPMILKPRLKKLDATTKKWPGKCNDQDSWYDGGLPAVEQVAKESMSTSPCCSRLTMLKQPGLIFGAWKSGQLKVRTSAKFLL